MKLKKTPQKVKILVLLLLITNFILFSYGQQLSKPVNKRNPHEKVIYIKTGTSLNEIGQQLYNFDLIKSPFIFKLYLQIKGLTKKVQAGYYRLNSGLSTYEIINKLVKGKTASYKVTIPEGASVEEIANIIAKQGLDKEKFLNLAKTKKLSFVSAKKDLSYNLEGFLFPETYKIPYGASEFKVIQMMLNEFNQRIQPLKDEIEQSNYSLKQIITIASLIEAEAKYDKENQLIASVIYNRLNKGMKLQLDATVQYSLEKRKSKLLYRDLTVDSPYNTYQHFGLPPGPINNPGIEAIKSALNPKDTNYLYYVANEDGYHKFTKNYRQHLKVQQKLNN